MADIEAKSDVTGAVWKIVTDVGQRVEAGETIMIIESMKMEIPVICEEAGVVQAFLVEENTSVNEGQIVAILAS